MKYIFSLFFLLSINLLQSQSADMIIVNAIVYNHENTQSNNDALAIKDGIILAIGPSDDLLKHRGSQTEILDAKGHFLMPGFIEGHGHFHGTGLSNLNLNLMNSKNWNEILNLVKEAVNNAKDGEWITGRGWHQEKWNQRLNRSHHGFPYHDELSQISPNNPVILRHASGHLLLANQKAMDLAKIDKKSISPAGGEIMKDDQDNPIGIFNETAQSLIRKAQSESMDKQSSDEIWTYWNKCIKKAEEICLKNGICSFQDAGSSFEEIKMYRSLSEKDDLKVRLWCMLNDDIDEIENKIADYLSQDENQYFKFGGIKAYIDGALGSRGAWLLEPYSDMPDSHGHRIISDEDFNILAKVCFENNLQLCTHAIGDRGNRVVFDTYEKFLDSKDRRWRIEHAQHLNPIEIGRFNELGIIAAMQPNHCTSDAPFVIKRLGEKRAEEGAYVWRKILNSKAQLNLGTDTPVEDLNPFKNIYAATTRVLPSGSGEAFYPGQILSRREALYYYTMGNAYSVFEENTKGSLDIGKLADLIILDTNLILCSDKELLDAKVLYTIIGGEIKYNLRN